MTSDQPPQPDAWSESEQVGPFYDLDGARAALGGVSAQVVEHHVAAGELLALQLAGGGLVYPAWQFPDAVLPTLPRVLAAAGYDPDRPTTGWTIAAWLTTVDPGLGELSPIELLERDDDDRVIAVAREVAVSLGVDERHGHQDRL